MEEQLIEFETAKLAKEKGFDWRVFHFWDEFGKTKSNEYLNHNKENDYFPQEFSRPTQNLLQKWLREVHNIDLDIYRNVLTTKYRLNEIYLNCKEVELLDDEKEYKTYEEALEQGLIQALKLIK